MELLVKFIFFAIAGLFLLACNVYFIQAVLGAGRGGDLVIAPVEIIGVDGDAKAAGGVLARMIVSSLQSLAYDLNRSQKALQADGEDGAAAAKVSAGKFGGVAAAVFEAPKIAVLDAEILDPADFEVKVGGVDVGGFIPRLQKWFVADRTLAFTVSMDKTSAVVTGAVDGLGLGQARPVSFRLDNATTKDIADRVAMALINRVWAKQIPEIEELSDEEFQTLIDVINKVAAINRQVVTDKTIAETDFQTILTKVNPLVDRFTGWGQLTYFVATIAEAGENQSRALELYVRLKGMSNPPITAEQITAKIAALRSAGAPAVDEARRAAEEKMKADIADATKVLNTIFGVNLPPPELVLAPDDYLNAYWDGKKVHAPQIVQTLPDILYHETAWPFIQSRWAFDYAGQSGAIAQSYTDILTSLVKQSLAKQTAQTADWTIAPGAIAWLLKKPSSNDRQPLRSLRAPGTAFDAPALGKDLQIANYSAVEEKPVDPQAAVYQYSGIPNKAFYATAIKIGSENAGKIWVAALSKLPKTAAIKDLASVTQDAAKSIFGERSAEWEAVKNGWREVGL